MTDDSPQPDQIPGAPHPRDTPRLIGQAPAEAAFLSAFNADRLHHAWLLSGPRGVGKATLAWRIARFLRATPPQDDGLFGSPPAPATLDVAPDHPVHALIDAQAEPGLRRITRSENDQGRLRAEIVADDIRALGGFFGLSLPDGGRRVVIVDAADDMNVTAANALLKMLEEPPADTVILLISHQPSRLLPTIRSRCRSLRLSPLDQTDLGSVLTQAGIEPGENTSALSALSGGSAGDAIRLLTLGGLDLYAEIVALLASLPRLNRPAALALAEKCAGRGAEQTFALIIELLDIALVRLARTGATGTSLPEAALQEAETFARLAPNASAARQWANLAASTGARLRHGQAVNLDPAALVLDTLIKLNDTASKAA